jgi:S-adenosylmethionine synthetase
MRYVDGKPHSIDTVVLSNQHSPEMSLGHRMPARRRCLQRQRPNEG